MLLLLVVAAPAARAELQEIYHSSGAVKTRIYTIVSKQGDVLRHGGFERFYSNGIQHVQGRYLRDKPVGIWSWWNEEGILIRRVRYDGKFEELIFGQAFNSPETVFSNTAGYKIAQGLLKHDKGHGEWRYWYNTGQLKAKGKFISGKPDGRWVMLYQDGQVKSVKEYQLGILHGQFTQAYASGQEQIKGRMELGMKVGRWRDWYASGQLKSKGKYLNDLEDGEWRYWGEDGELLATVLYRAGKPVKVRPSAPRPSGKPQRDPVIPREAQQREVNPGVYDGDDRPIRQKYYDAEATPKRKKGRRWRPSRGGRSYQPPR